MLELASGFKPVILILSSDLYKGYDLKILKDLRRKHPRLIIIVFTDYNIDEYRKEAILQSATNYLMSKELWTGSEIMSLIKTILTTKKN